MKNILCAMLTAIALLALPASSHALFGKSSVKGTVQAANTDSVTVLDQKGDMVYVNIDPQTKIKGGVEVASLKTGDRVKVDYKDDKGIKTATSISTQM